MKMEMINCSRCSQPMPKLRKEKYGYDFCINCSTVGAKKGIPTTFGKGDHTYTELVIFDDDDD